MLSSMFFLDELYVRNTRDTISLIKFICSFNFWPMPILRIKSNQSMRYRMRIESMSNKRKNKCFDFFFIDWLIIINGVKLI